MTYEEFCEGVGMAVDRKCYERIEAVYMAFDRFSSKQDIYDFYKMHDMNGIETLFTELYRFNKLSEQRMRLEGEIAKYQRELTDTIGELNKAAMLCGVKAA